MDWLATLILTVTLLGGRTDPTSVVPSTVDPFSAARHVPAAVRVFLHVEDGATLHGLLADRPIGATMTDDFVSDALMTQWATLAETLRLAPGTLVDEALGRSATWVMRGSAPDQEWVVLTAIAPADGQRMLHTLRTRIQPARDHAQIHLLPEQDWLIGLGHGHVIVAPRQHPGLFNEVLQHLDRADQPAGRAADTLLADPALTELRKLGGGRIGYFIRPQGLVGGWSGGVLDTDGAIVRWEHLSKLDPPATAIVEHAWNTSIIGTLDDVGLAAFAEPLRTAPDLMSGFVEEMVGMPLLPADIRANLGARQLTVVGETDGRDETPATDMLLPTVARVYEVRDGALARRQLDTHVPRLLRAMEDVARRAGEAVAPLTLPTPTMLAKDEPRHVDVHALTGAFIEGSP
ncbi:MAG: hypothetical protein KDA25_01885, partial [Phycisphaerales bacterium]|nr:hypothetical protein [Phycisphaerales bacterium]